MILKMPMRERPEQNYLSAAVHKTWHGRRELRFIDLISYQKRRKGRAVIADNVIKS
jgi:hypothetical protein